MTEQEKKKENLKYINIGFHQDTIDYLDRTAAQLGVSRNSVIRWVVGTMKVKSNGGIGF